MKPLTLAILLALPLPALGHDGQHAAPLPMQVSRATERIVLPDIPVTDQRGMTQGFLSRYGPRGPLLVSFLYTNCTEVCLMTQATLSDLDRDLAGPGAPPLTILSITVDPGRDTPEVLARSASDMAASAKWDWLRAAPSETPVLLTAFGVPAGPIEAHENVYFLGDLARGDFTRITGNASAEDLLALARQLP